jgi:nucleoside-diphosphate-sugar epimerase
MRLLVTGGAGFIGSHLIQHLVSKGHSVIVVDNLHSGKIENLTEVKEKIIFHRIDILEYDKLRSISKDVDGIFHEAALTDVQESFIKPKEYRLVNVTGTENVFKIAKEFGIKVVHASSSSVYGTPERIPVKEDSKRRPLNPYGETKLQDELLAEKYSSKGAKIIGLRYFNAYGKGQSISYAGVITKFLERIRNLQPPIIYGDGLQVRDFVYVGDVARANLIAMESKIDSAFINIGSGKITSILELANMIVKLAGLEMRPIHEKPLQGDVKESQADISLAEKMIGWKPEMKLEDWLSGILH